MHFTHYNGLFFKCCQKMSRTKARQSSKSMNSRSNKTIKTHYNINHFVFKQNSFIPEFQMRNYF